MNDEKKRQAWAAKPWKDHIVNFLADHLDVRMSKRDLEDLADDIEYWSRLRRPDAKPQQDSPVTEAMTRACRFCDKPVDWFTDGLPEDACMRCAKTLRRERTERVNTAHTRGWNEAIDACVAEASKYRDEYWTKLAERLAALQAKPVCNHPETIKRGCEGCDPRCEHDVAIEFACSKCAAAGSYPWLRTGEARPDLLPCESCGVACNLTIKCGAVVCWDGDACNARRRERATGDVEEARNLGRVLNAITPETPNACATPDTCRPRGYCLCPTCAFCDKLHPAIHCARKDVTKTHCDDCGQALPGERAEPRPCAEPVPVPMFLTCPKCNARHIDEGDFATKRHHTHSCQACGLTWRPAVVPTVGVAFLPGFKNESPGPSSLGAEDDANALTNPSEACVAGQEPAPRGSSSPSSCKACQGSENAMRSAKYENAKLRVIEEAARRLLEEAVSKAGVMRVDGRGDEAFSNVPCALLNALDDALESIGPPVFPRPRAAPGSGSAPKEKP